MPPTAIRSLPLAIRRAPLIGAALILLSACGIIDPAGEQTRIAASFTATPTSTLTSTRTFTPPPTETATATADMTAAAISTQAILSSKYLGVCRGTAIAESVVFDRSNPPFPTVLCDKRSRTCRFLNESNKFDDLLPADFDPSLWNPPSPAELQLVLCFNKETFSKMGYCNYKDGKNNAYMVPYGILTEYWDLYAAKKGAVVKGFAIVEKSRAAGCPKTLGSIPERITGTLNFDKFALEVLAYLGFR